MQVANFKKQKGQAIAEFNVTAAFVLLPLFIMIPVVGKYIDMKHSSVQTARYLAWEQTVWSEPGVAGDDADFIATKDIVKTGREALKRNMSAVAIDGLEDDALNPLWHDRGTAMVKSSDDILLSYDNRGNEDVLGRSRDGGSASGKQSLPYKAIDTTSQGLGIAANATMVTLSSAINAFNEFLASIGINKGLPGISNPNPVKKFQFKGYYRANVTMNVNNEQFESLFKTRAVPFVSKAAVLTDSWVTADSGQFAERTDAFVPFAPFRKVFKPIRDAFTWGPPFLALAPEFKELDFGYVNTNPVTDSSVILNKEDCPGGLCSYEN